MSKIQEQISNKDHTDWVRCTLGLSKTTWALYDYVLNKFKNYTHRKCQLKPSQHFLTHAEEAHIRSSAGCIRISLDTKVRYQRRQSRWEWRDTCQICKGAFEKIIALHDGVYNQTSHNENGIYWLTNCRDTTGVTLEWAIAKMFMPEGNENNMTPQDTDPAALLTILMKCNLFTNPIRQAPKYRLRKAMHKLYHSRDNRVDETDKNDCFDDMCQILTDASNDMEVEEDIRKTILKDIMEIKKLKEAEISMKMFDDALKEKRKGLFDDFEKCLSNFENEKDIDEIRRFLEFVETNAADIQFVNDNINELKKIEFYKNEIERLNRLPHVEENTTLFGLIIAMALFLALIAVSHM
ncbi:uncharacterized protein LOC132746270 isoform X2 [Ruditapes philippinarum]|uniref:uncharacterized protein LOC132746270 isoform X2 n=1 Tax=Ruditapes philippinarum TaxID=129788 RepID=UPI00295B98EC|nr:uncharacterized protein LOC132746270 isoform X2 [Ruditapes philippinarum]